MEELFNCAKLEQENAALKKRVEELEGAMDVLDKARVLAVSERKKTEADLARLVEAVERHKSYLHTNEPIGTDDKELYAVLDEIKEGK